MFRKILAIIAIVALAFGLAPPAVGAWGMPGGHQLWNHGLSLYTIGQWDYEAHYWTSPPGGVSDLTHPYIPRPNGALEWVNVQAINLGPGSCGWLYKFEVLAGPWGPANTWRFLWVTYGYSKQSGLGLAYHISGLPDGKYQFLGSFQANGNGPCVWVW